MKPYLFVGLGGFVGAILRHAANMGLAGKATPVQLGTLTVNAVGSFGLGLLIAYSAAQRGLSEEWRLALGVGLCGALTTFSTFSVETIELARTHSWRLAGLNLVLNASISLVAAWAGMRLLAGPDA